MAPYVQTVRGAENPSLIRKAEYIKHLVPASASIKVESRDAEVLAALREDFEQLQETIEARGAQRVRQVCQEVAAGALQPTELFTREAAAESADDQERIRLYDEAISDLSGLGRATVQRFLNQTLLPSMTTVDVDFAAMALQHPEETAVFVQRMCDSPAARQQ
jgi:hypothetical protein